MPPALPTRARQVLQLTQEGKTPQEIAEELEVTRNAVYQQITRLRREGFLPQHEGSNSELSVDDTYQQFRASLLAQLARIEERRTEYRAKLAECDEEQQKVKLFLDRLDTGS